MYFAEQRGFQRPLRRQGVVFNPLLKLQIVVMRQQIHCFNKNSYEHLARLVN